MIQMEMNLKTKPRLRKNPPYNPNKDYVLYALGFGRAGKFVYYREAEVVADFKRSYGYEPPYLLKTGGGWIAGPVPDDEAKRRREKIQ